MGYRLRRLHFEVLSGSGELSGYTILKDPPQKLDVLSLSLCW